MTHASTQQAAAARFGVMKTTATLILALALTPVIVSAEDKGAGEKISDKAAQAWEKTKEATKEAGAAIAEGSREAAERVKDAVQPDAREVQVTLDGRRIDMPNTLPPGKTAFVVHNKGTEKHSFEIEGAGVDDELNTALNPNETKVLHVELKPGRYEVSCPVKDHDDEGMKLYLTVK
jgi:uncharacterized cupredoxin-like copper-binding protein